MTQPQPGIHPHDTDPTPCRPFYLVAGLSPSNPLIQSLKERGCGSCLEVECIGASCHPGVGPVQALITDECAERCSSSQVGARRSAARAM
jgi:hypothetical protein